MSGNVFYYKVRVLKRIQMKVKCEFRRSYLMLRANAVPKLTLDPWGKQFEWELLCASDDLKYAVLIIDVAYRQRYWWC